MKNYLILICLCCVAIVANSYSIFAFTDQKDSDIIIRHSEVISKKAGTVTMNMSNDTQENLPVSGVYLKQNGNTVMTLYFPTAQGVNFYTDIPEGTYQVVGFFSGANPEKYRYGLPLKGPKCGPPETDFGTYNLLPADHLSVICILASKSGFYGFCSGN